MNFSVFHLPQRLIRLFGRSLQMIIIFLSFVRRFIGDTANTNNNAIQNFIVFYRYFFFFSRHFLKSSFQTPDNVELCYHSSHKDIVIMTVIKTHQRNRITNEGCKLFSFLAYFFRLVFVPAHAEVMSCFCSAQKENKNEEKSKNDA